MTGSAFCTTPISGPTGALAQQLQAMIPILETERLILRAVQIEDFDAFQAILASPGGHFFGDATEFEDAWAEFVHLTGLWLLRGHGAWAVTMRKTGAVVGFVQIGAEPGDMEPELGWVVAEAARGQGIAQEAATAVRDYAFGPAGLASLVSYVDFDNAPSRHLAQRLGAVRDPEAEALLSDDDACCAYRHSVGGRA